jgi:hypothetical protein
MNTRSNQRLSADSSSSSNLNNEAENNFTATRALSLHTQIERLQAQLFALQQAQAQPATPVVKELKLPPIEKIDGTNLQENEQFVKQLDNNFEFRPLTFSSERIKIAFAISHLKGAVFEWASKKEFLNFDMFKQEFLSQYGDRYKELRAEKAIKNLKQRGRPAEKLAAELRFHAANVDLCDNSLKMIFDGALDPELKTLVTTQLDRKSLSFENFVSKVVELDMRLRESRPDFKQHSGFNNNSRRFNNNDKYFSKDEKKNYNFPPEKFVKKNFNEQKPVTKNGRLTDEERQRRINENLCLFCGDSQHSLKDCFRAAAKEKKSRFKNPSGEEQAQQ